MRLILALALALAPGFPARAYAPEPAPPLPPAALLLGLELQMDGRLAYVEQGLGGDKKIELLSPKAERRVRTFLEFLPASDPEDAMARALRAYLAPRMPSKELDNNLFLRMDPQGRLRLTGAGRIALLDVLCAEDGSLPEPPSISPPPPAPGVPRGPGVAESAEAFKPLGEKLSLASAEPARVFDGAFHDIENYDWDELKDAVAEFGGPQAVRADSLSGYAYDKEKGTLRVLVASDRLLEDRFRVPAAQRAQRDVYAEAGLDADLFEYYGARIVRTIDNLLAIDVPARAAALLGKALAGFGVDSRPARVLRAASAALRGTPGALLGTSLLPFPSATLPEEDPLRAGELRRGLGSGSGALIGFIDSGLDREHPDFKDKDGKSRVAYYRDFSEEGPEDSLGHGTHVAGLAAGGGAASEGRHVGAAPEARLKVAKVFGAKDEVDETVILSAMKWMVSGSPEEKVDVLNLSLGDAGPANKDPMGAMVNRLVAREGVVVVAVAGNAGGRGHGTVGTPGNARYALTVSGVDRQGRFPFFVSKGPIFDERGELYNKPDLTALSGTIDPLKLPKPPEAQGALASVPSNAPGCVHAPYGVIGPRSSKDGDSTCAVEGEPGYRYFSGTSMAGPMVSGAAADVIAYLKERGVEYDPFEIRALLMETARGLGQERHVQGAGLLDGRAIAQAVLERVKRGLPVGNVAFALSMRLTESDLDKLARGGYEWTPLGIRDKESGRLVNDAAKLERLLESLRRPPEKVKDLERAPLWEMPST